MLQAVVVDSQAILESSFEKWCFWFQLPDIFPEKKMKLPGNSDHTTKFD